MGQSELAVTASVEADLRALQDWLAEDPDLRSRVHVRESPPAPGTLGPVLEALLVAVGPGGVASAFAATLISWIRHRTGDVQLRVTRGDGSVVEISGTHVRELTPAELRDLLRQLAETWADGGDQAAEPP